MDKSYLLSAINPLISTTLFVTFFFLWRRQCGDRTYVLNWAITYACAALGSSVDFARVFVNDARPLSFFANIFFVGVAYFAVRGTIVRNCGQAVDPGVPRAIAAIFATSVAFGFWFCFVDPSVAGRGAVASGSAALMFLVAARIIWKTSDLDTLDRLIAWTYVLSAATLAGRIVVSMLYEGPLRAESEVAGSFWIVSFKIFAMLSWLAFAILFLLRITTDLMKELSTQSHMDPLTELFNRRGFFSGAEPLMRSNPQMPFVAMICDIDHFKRVNDTYGHQTGDRVIQCFADVLRQSTENVYSLAGRFGGEEFVVLLPDMRLAQGQAVAEQIRLAFAGMDHAGIPAALHEITVSIGIAESSDAEGIDSLIERADRALYKAKRDGRNRVEAGTVEPKDANAAA
ncbi:GGDEF domain-containing protein [Rhizobiaceae bacterium n13]|uniref:diguanylate cyclase n=1 Tax=Ferirhizobium litorale TaxID=2927786 RepID=A0AAE3QFW2_9HYPH|nr:GGDEF domain-containing protein [Fererhizobium litorale]MDI7862116.1 GGDEF domain-containing protein [Fererhizobium litorale]MDI7922611.1 GGDEF domain-containing protein [Fererhizobium litorale]